MRYHAPVSVSLAFAAFASTAFAQTIVDPAHFRATESPYQGSRPFGRSSTGGWRYLQIHDGLKGAKATINELAWRRDGDRDRHTAYSFRCTLMLSTAAVAYDKIDQTFDNNHGTNKKTVVNFKEVSWPATRAEMLPAPFEYVIKFDQPYAFDGTGGGLCWEAQLSNIQNIRGTYYFDSAYRSSNDPNLETQPFGQGCYHSLESSPMEARGSSSMSWPSNVGTLYLDGRDLPPNTPVIGVLGVSRSSYAGLPLPFLLPGTMGTYSGPCYIHVSLDIILPSTADNNGNSRVAFPIPARSEFDGRSLYGQWLAIDTASPAPLPLVTSNGMEFQWVEPYPDPELSRVYASNNFANTGSTNVNQGLVTGAR